MIRFIEEIVWVKLTNKMNLAKCHGYYLQHAKETCLVGMRGDFQFDRERLKNVIIAQRREQSQKPNELYEIIESIAPGASFLEIFGRRNNLRSHWTTIGNELDTPAK